MIRKIVDDFVSKLLTEAPQRTISVLTAGAITRRRLNTFFGQRLRLYLLTTAKLIYRDGLLNRHYDQNGSCRPGYQMTNVAVFLYRRVPIMLRHVPVAVGPNHIEVSAIRGTVDLDAVIRQMCAKNSISRFGTYVHSGRGFASSINADAISKSDPPGEIEEEPEHTTRKAPDFLWHSPALEEMLTAARQWYGSRKWCEERSLGWKYGMLQWGAPGNGKTANARAVAEALDIPMHCFLISSMTDQDFTACWDKAMQSQPCMVLIEDFDDTIRGRQNVRSPDKGVSFSTIINCIDGAQKAQGVLLVMTTNDLSAVDPALGRPDEGQTKSSRPGRIDRVVHVEPPNEAGRLHIATRVCGGDAVWAGGLAAAGEGMSLAQFQRMCQDEALDEHYTKNDGDR